jgi:hypothetical protein
MTDGGEKSESLVQSFVSQDCAGFLSVFKKLQATSSSLTSGELQQSIQFCNGIIHSKGKETIKGSGTL